MSNTIERSCQTCEEPFFVEASQLKFGFGLFCSRACFYESLRIPIEVCFARCPKTTTERGCIEWDGSRDKKGYGRIGNSRDKERLAHRIAWRIAFGEIPDGLWVLHACDNPACVNVAHLFLGTVQDNAADMMAKNRQAKGECKGGAKLTDGLVKELRQKYSEGETARSLSRDYGIPYSTVFAAVNRRTWRHI